MSRSQHHRWLARRAIAALFILVVATACGSSPATGGGGSASKGSTTITVAYTDSPIAIEDVPLYLAINSLASQGIKAHNITVSDASLLVPGLIKNDIQVTIESPPHIFGASATAPIVGFFDYKKEAWLLVSAANIKTPAQLDGHQIVVDSEASFTNAIAKQYIADNHLSNTSIEFISGSNVRAEAIASNKISAAVIDVEDLTNLESVAAPGSFHVLANFATKYSWLTSAMVTADRTWLNAHRSIATAIAVALLKTVRKMYADPQWAVQQVQAYYRQTDRSESPAVVKKIVMEYLSEKLWRPNGGPAVSSALRQLSFYAHLGESGGLPVDSASVQKIFDLQFLDAALKMVGTK